MDRFSIPELLKGRKWDHVCSMVLQGSKKNVYFRIRFGLVNQFNSFVIICFCKYKIEKKLANATINMPFYFIKNCLNQYFLKYITFKKLATTF